MRRKLVKQGNATMMVSLPAKWIHEHNLAKGAEITIEPYENNLIISAERVEVKSETTITLKSSAESSIRTLITNAYRTGYDLIIVNFEDSNQLAALTDIIKTRLIGFDILKKEKNKCIVENITEPSPELFDTLIKKIFYNIDELFDITKIRFESKGDFELQDIEEIQERIQKYDNFCRRVISKRKFKNQRSELVWSFLVLVIHGNRELYHLNRYLDKEIIISDQTKELLSDTEHIFEFIKRAFLEKNISYLSEVHTLEKELIYKKGYSLLQKKKGKENVIIYHILACIRQFYQANSPLSGLIM